MEDAELVAAAARGLADPSRAAMCLALMDGQARTVSALAAEAGIGLPAASEHVTRLEQAGLVAKRIEGRHKYVRLAGPNIAELLESLCRMGEPAPKPRSLSAVRRTRHLAAARTCYDHLAGRLGVAIFDGLLDVGVLRRRGGLAVTSAGRKWFGDLGIVVDDLEQRRRVLLRGCLDLTERRPHLAGSLGASLATAFLEHGWVRRTGSGRALRVTHSGELAVQDLLAIPPATLTVA